MDVSPLGPRPTNQCSKKIASSSTRQSWLATSVHLRKRAAISLQMRTHKRISSLRWPIRWHMIWTARRVSRTSKTTSKKQTSTQQPSRKPWAPSGPLTKKRASELPISQTRNKIRTKEPREANCRPLIRARCPTSIRSIAPHPDAATQHSSSSNTEERRLRPLLPSVKGGKQACRSRNYPAITHSTFDNEATNKLDWVK